MNRQPAFRWIVVGIVMTNFAISAWFRRRARRTSEVIPRKQESAGIIALRLLFAAPLYLGLLAYMLNPRWLRWSAMPLPTWLRWIGVAIAAATVPLVFWTFRSIGSNISETVLTKTDHKLVTHGPYRWVRHPLYSSATAMLIGVGLIAANWFLLGMALVIGAAAAWLVVPREEAQLIEKFGDRYRGYQRATGALLPRWRR